MARGLLGRDADEVYIENDEGRRVSLSEPVWEGYLTHWLGRRVRVHRLPQCDYESRAPVLLLAPDEPAPPPPYIVLYYNERLTGYLSSLFGHLSINVDGRVFSFSETLNENEEISLDEFLYRPALGEFSGHPETLTFNVDDASQPYYDKFGRRFMRTIHALRIEGLDTVRLTELLRTELTVIYETPMDPRRPHKYRDFHFLHRSCTTIIRNALREVGLREISGLIPRELFLNVAYQMTLHGRLSSLTVSASRMDQLKVPERAYSRPNPILNPMNRLRLSRLSEIPGAPMILER
jgi:hypothetical protein